MAHAASSTIQSFRFFAIARIGSISAQRPKRWTGINPTVRGVIRRSIFFTSILKVARSMSQKTGFAPMSSTIFAVATQVNAGTITSSPGFKPSAATARWRAVVHEVEAAAKRAFV
jgi:hypothetical protein